MVTKIKQPENIIKRDGRTVPFDKQKIENAMIKCFERVGVQPQKSFKDMTKEVINIISAKNDGIPTVEEIQDIVEIVLFASSEYQAAKEYILYRSEHNKNRDGREVPDYIKETFQDSVQYFPTDIQQFQFYDKYSRYNYEYGRRETWAETVRRTVLFLRELSKDKLSKETYNEIEQYILNMWSSPSMRMLAMAGEAARINNISIYNCSYLPVDCIDAFVEMLIISMSGSGVGYSVESQYTENLPRIKRRDKTHPIRFIVPDSSSGWAEALRLGLNTWFNGGDVIFDYSLIRPSGTPLKTKGGRASGPEPLIKMMNFIKSKLQKRQGGFLHPLDAHDIMCIIGDASIQGGSRRTALICLFDFGDIEMRQCKNGDNINGNEQRWNANNSEVWPERELTQEEVVDFMLEMIKSGRGESGIFNRLSARNTRPERRRDADFGTNPSLRKGTKVITDFGIFPIEELENKNFKVLNLNGKWSDADCILSGKNKPLYKISLSGNVEYYCTEEHKWPKIKLNNLIEKTLTSELKIGDKIPVNISEKKYGDLGNYSDGFLIGWIYGDGWIHQRKDNDKQQVGIIISEKDAQNGILEVINSKLIELGINTSWPQRKRKNGLMWYELNTQNEKLNNFLKLFGAKNKKEGLPSKLLNDCSKDFSLGFLDGLISSDGSVYKKRVGITTAHETFANELHEFLGFMGIYSSKKKTVAKTNFSPEGQLSTSFFIRFPTYFAKDLVITNKIKNITKDENMSKPAKIFNRKVVSIEKTDLIEDVWDVRVNDDTHCFSLANIITGNCGEILLRKNSFCNLSAAVAREDDTLESLSKKVEIATIIGTIQSMATDFPGLRPIWKQNCEEERLLGVDINGQMDSKISRDPLAQQHFKQVAIDTNIKYAEILGIPQSAAVTCIKPSGNSSQLYNTSSGLHARHSKYYIRNIRVSAFTPMYKVIRDSGAPMQPENGQTKENATAWVIQFPVKSPDEAILKEHTSAIDQCNYWLQVKKNYTEHNPSVTISYKDNEILDLIKWVWKNQKYIGGMSFLPYFDAQYNLMPYQEIDEEEYLRRKAEFPVIDFSKIYKYELEDFTTASQELACVSGVCEVP